MGVQGRAGQGVPSSPARLAEPARQSLSPQHEASPAQETPLDSVAAPLCDPGALR